MLILVWPKRPATSPRWARAGRLLERACGQSRPDRAWLKGISVRQQWAWALLKERKRRGRRGPWWLARAVPLGGSGWSPLPESEPTRLPSPVFTEGTAAPSGAGTSGQCSILSPGCLTGLHEAWPLPRECDEQAVSAAPAPR